jgi:hypothetical protein
MSLIRKNTLSLSSPDIFTPIRPTLPALKYNDNTNNTSTDKNKELKQKKSKKKNKKELKIENDNRNSNSGDDNQSNTTSNSNNMIVERGGYVHKSKKHWFTTYSESYKENNDEYRKKFNLPLNEYLLDDYAAALKKEILAHGRLYISENNICFHAYILTWEAILVIHFKDVTSIRKDGIKLFSNTISITTNRDEKYSFTSFVSRDKVHACLINLWNRSQQNEKLSRNEILSFIYNSYGEDLQYTLDINQQKQQKQITINSEADEKRHTEEEEEDHHDQNKRIVDNNVLLTNLKHRQEISKFNELNKISEEVEEEGDLRRQKHHGLTKVHSKSISQQTLPFSVVDKSEPESDDSQSSDNDSSSDDDNESTDLNLELRVNCGCVEHKGVSMLDKTIDIPVNLIYDYLFGHTASCSHFWRLCNAENVVIGEWEFIDSFLRRNLEYILDLKLPFVMGKSLNKEAHIIRKFESNRCFIFESESFTYRIPFSDYFFVRNRYCVSRVTKKTSQVTMHTDFIFIKSLNFITKGFIQKNAMMLAGKACDNLINRYLISDRRCTEDNISHEPEIDKIKAFYKAQQQKEKKKPKEKEVKVQRNDNIKEQVSNNQIAVPKIIKKTKKKIDPITTVQQFNNKPQLINDNNNKPVESKSGGTSTYVLIILICLMILNIVLYYKLLYLESIGNKIQSHSSTTGDSLIIENILDKFNQMEKNFDYLMNKFETKNEL